MPHANTCTRCGRSFADCFDQLGCDAALAAKQKQEADQYRMTAAKVELRRAVQEFRTVTNSTWAKLSTIEACVSRLMSATVTMRRECPDASTEIAVGCWETNASGAEGAGRR